MTIEQKYIHSYSTSSDINEHIQTLYEYARQVNHITECGVRTVVSSYAFANGLRNRYPNKLVQVDLETNQNVINFKKECNDEGINVVFYQQSDLECPIEETDLLFIDTWHVYGHLKRELERWNCFVRKYIIMHDTTIDGEFGETIRVANQFKRANMTISPEWDAIEQSKKSKIPVDEINKGLWYAIEEFLKNNPNWILEKRFTNNNGLTILKRKT